MAVKSYAAQIAADVRDAVRKAKAAGELQTLPAGARLTVSSRSGSMFSAVTIRIAGVSPEWAWKWGHGSPALKDDARAVADRLRECGTEAADGRGWGEVQIDDGTVRRDVGVGWTPAGWVPGQD